MQLANPLKVKTDSTWARYPKWYAVSRLGMIIVYFCAAIMTVALLLGEGTVGELLFSVGWSLGAVALVVTFPIIIIISFLTRKKGNKKKLR